MAVRRAKRKHSLEDRVTNSGAGARPGAHSICTFTRSGRTSARSTSDAGRCT